MIQNIKAHIQLDLQIGMSVEPTMSTQNQKFNDVLLSDIVKSPSTGNAL